jgi:dihydropteroate synthase-like protein
VPEGPMRKVLFVTGKLAAPALEAVLSNTQWDFEPEIAVMKITVAALMTTPWIAKQLRPPPCDLILIPGLCEGDPQVISEALGIPAQKGPKDLKDIPEYFGRRAIQEDYGAYDIQILAEINNAPKLSVDEIIAQAEYYRASGADVIDVGCTPGLPFPELETVVRELRDRGIRVSIDTFDPDEIRRAVSAGAELVLNVNRSNLEVAKDLPATVVVIPDFGEGLESLERNIETLQRWTARYIIDPITDPVGFGLASSLYRYYVVRQRHPESEILMGMSNVTELLEADTTGVNALLIGFCQELGIRYVLTTEVTPWARGCVREIDIARRMMHYAIRHQTLPKHLDSRLVTTKDPKITVYTEAELRALQAQITDPNFRIYTDGETIYVFNAERFVKGTDIQEIFGQLGVDEATHAFYLGKELQKAKLAIQLGKTYRQEGQLSWGYLTPPEDERKEHVKLTKTLAARTKKV